ncbi:cytochrome d ubiquinol oxidase subunit II [Paraburkholderia caribensis]
MDIATCWTAIITFGVGMYIALDGFDLGIGILLPFFSSEYDRELLFSSRSPAWRGNAIWMGFGGASLYAAFPTVCSVLLSALYLPLVAMVLCLIFRSVALRNREKAGRSRMLWNRVFIFGSAGGTFFQGVMLGDCMAGMRVEHGLFVGNQFDWFTPFCLVTGLALLITYALIGCCWLIAKTEGELQRKLYRTFSPLTALQLLTIAGLITGLVSLVMYGLLGCCWFISRSKGELQRKLYRVVLPLAAIQLLVIVGLSMKTEMNTLPLVVRWFDWSVLRWLLPAPLLIAAASCGMQRAVAVLRGFVPFVVAVPILLLGYIGLLINLWPFSIFSGMSIWHATALPSNEVFKLVGAAMVIPILLAYTLPGYRFAGRERDLWDV